MKNILFITNLAKKIGNFSKGSIYASRKCGINYNIAANWDGSNSKQLMLDEKKYGIKIHDISLSRSPYSFFKNYKAYKQLLSIINEEKIDYIHCNTPVGGVLGRIVGKKCDISKVIYQVHGFHFYKGAPFFNRTIIKWSEQIMARWTDAIITMNEEDYQAAMKFKLRKGGKVYKVNGVGISLDEFNNINVDKKIKRLELGLRDDDIVCISAGDLIDRKNYKVAIEALSKTDNSNLHYLICGIGPEKDNLIKFAKDKGVNDRVHFLGFRDDIVELMKVSDIFLFTTLQEGLPRSMMEAMACGLPCVASKIRGNVDLIDDGKGGFLRDVDDVDGFADGLQILSDDITLRKKMSIYNKEIIKNYDINFVKKEMENIYKDILV